MFRDWSTAAHHASHLPVGHRAQFRAQVGVELRHALCRHAGVHNRVAPVDRLGLVAHQGHRGRARDARSLQVPHRRPAEVVQDAARDAGQAAGLSPRLPESLEALVALFKCALCRRLLEWPASESGRLCRGDRGHGRGHRRRRALMLAILHATVQNRAVTTRASAGTLGFQPNGR